MTCRILVVDDSTPIQKVIKIAFSKYAVEIHAAASLSEALRECDKAKPDLIIADASLPGVAAASDLSRLLSKSQGAAMVMLMGSYDSVREADLRAAGFENVVKKPFDAAELLTLCEKLLPGLLMTSSGGSKSNAPAVDTSKTSPLSVNRKAVAPPGTPTKSLPLPNIVPPKESPSIQFSLESSVAPPSFLLEPVGQDAEIPIPPKLDMSRKGRLAFEPGSQPPAPIIAEKPNNHGGSADDFLRRELPVMVERAVERYCSEHFKGIAREVLTAELRRLAEEKARYLVDQ